MCAVISIYRSPLVKKRCTLRSSSDIVYRDELPGFTFKDLYIRLPLTCNHTRWQVVTSIGFELLQLIKLGLFSIGSTFAQLHIILQSEQMQILNYFLDILKFKWFFGSGALDHSVAHRFQNQCLSRWVLLL